MAVVAGDAWRQQAQVNSTRQTLEAIEKALSSYAKLNGRLPCPGDPTLTPGDDDFGYEAWESATETLDSDACLDATGDIEAVDASSGVVFGTVPVKTLGLADSSVFDQWGHFIVYYVTERATEEGSFWYASDDSNYLTWDDAAAGAIEIQDKAGATLTDRAMYALLSHGKNGHGGVNKRGNRTKDSSATAPELENCDCAANATPTTPLNNVLVQQLIDSSFDDILLYSKRGSFLFDVAAFR